MMANKMRIVLVAAAIALSVMSGMAGADVAVSLYPFSTEWAGMGAGTNGGWQFTVNDPIIVTHLGLFDKSASGFYIDHPIGLWRLSDSALLASGTMSAGKVNLLLDYFRYIDVPDVALDVGQDYVIGVYSESCNPPNCDRVILRADDLQVDAAIDIVVRRWDIAGQFQMPANIYEWDPYGGEPYYPDEFGPNFQFIPEPGTILLLSLGGLILRKRHRR